MRIGKITENALKRSVLKIIRTEFKDVKSAAVGSDCAFSNDERCFSAASPMTAGVSDGAYYAVVKAVNALVCQGIRADHFTLTVLLPPDTEEPLLKTIVKDACCAGKIMDVPYAGGHTEVTTAVTRPVVIAHAAGHADGNAASLFDVRPEAGQALVVTKWIALEGTAILAREKKEELVSRYPVPFIEDAVAFKERLDLRKEAEVLSELANRSEAGSPEDGKVRISVHDISSGGIFAALWEMAERGGCGLEADLKAIPIRQETIEVCEFLGVNPYLLTSAGSALIACDDEEALLQKLSERGINAAVIGHLKEGNERILKNDDEMRFLDMPKADELVRVMT